MWSQANMDAVAAAHGVFRGPIARNQAVVRWLCAATPEVEVTVKLVRQPTPVEYRACVVGRFTVNGVADAGARIVVLDPRRAAAEAAERCAALVRMEAALAALSAGLNKSPAKKAKSDAESDAHTPWPRRAVPHDETGDQGDGARHG